MILGTFLVVLGGSCRFLKVLRGSRRFLEVFVSF